MKIFDTKSNDELLARDSQLGRDMEKNNKAYQKEMERSQNDDYMKINCYSEGYCYGCAKRDKILQTVVYICTSCYTKRGKEGLFRNIIKKEAEELCDICGYWKFGVWQRNVAFCDKCVDRMEKIHNKYRGSGGVNPYYRGLRKRYGKDYKILTGLNP